MKFPSTVTTKGQVTIPKAVREFLDIDSGSNLVFTIEPAEERVYIKVEEKFRKCGLCKGSGQLDSQPCFFCLEAGKHVYPLQPLLLIPTWHSKYKVLVSFHMKNVEVNGRSIFAPEVMIQHDSYATTDLIRAKDLILISLFKSLVERDKGYLTHDELSILKSRLDTEVYKKNILDVFQLEG